MKKIIITILLFVSIVTAKIFTNELQYETSPYLLQHKNNPVNWMAWSDRAFAKAKKENKPIFLSLGYSTCHWCHVMERDSFTNEALAKLFNKYFVCIKVDREEMPHLDSLYQEIYLKLKHHSGGWPLSIFMTPNKDVFYVGTYLPAKKEHYSEGLDTLLPRLGEMYKNNSIEFQSLLQKNKKTLDAPVVYEKVLKGDISIKTLSDSLKKDYDDIYSGFGQGRKFPEAARLALMMDLADITQDEELKEYSLEMLDIMALRGLYDQVEGGFFRYTVDAAWEIPHFEKMLYDQAELIPLYVRAYLQTNKELYKNVVIETIAMLDARYVKNNLYYGASDADTNHIEGEYFTFTQKEMAQTKFKFKNNFEGKIQINFFDNKRPKGYEKFRDTLLKIRAKKEYPFIDKKINTAWNAMMIEALYSAAIIDKKYAQKAENTLEALSQFMFERGELYHQSVIGTKPTQKGLLEDYSFMISALISAYEFDYKDEHLDFAEYLLNAAKSRFYKKGIWYLSNDNLQIKADTKDKYYMSPLSKMAQNIAKFASLKASFRYEKLLAKTLDTLESKLKKKQSKVPALAQAYLMQQLKVVTLKSSQENLQKNAHAIRKITYPYLVTKKGHYGEYLACTIRQCFSKDQELKKVIKSINLFIRK